MAKIIFYPIYQTVRKEGSPRMIELLGPIYCQSNPWLGKGYYFWDGFIELAQWWGVKHYQSFYFICQAKLEVDSEVLFDLAGSTQDMRLFNSAYQLLKVKMGYRKMTVAAVLAAMRRMSNFPYKVIRARSEHHVFFNERLSFVENDKSYMNTIPAIQICVMDKNLLSEFHVLK